MKKNVSKLSWLGSVLAGATLLAATIQSQAQTITTSYTNTFGSAAKTASWNYWYDLPQSSGSPNMGWDGAVDHTPGEAGSGSLPYFINWPGTGAAGQMQIYGTFAEDGQYNTSQSIDATKYESVSFDLYVDPSSPTNSNGNICVLTVGLFHTYSIFTITNLNIPQSSTGSWVHYVCNINKAAVGGPTDLTQGVGFNVNLYGDGNPNRILNAQTTPTKIWIDNLQVNVSLVENPPPVMSKDITSASPGLNLFSTGDQFTRTSIKRTNQTELGFASQSSVTYLFNIKEFPDPAVYPNYQAHIFLTTGPGNASALDYNETNLIWLNVQGNNNGTATAYFRYKINEPNSNSNLFGAEYTVGPVGTAWAGQLANLPATTAVGTWSMTFDQGTNVTMSGPGGVSTNFIIRPEVAAAFVDPLNLVFGAQANEVINVGQKVVLSEAGATNNGTGTSIVYDNFLDDTTLDTAKWSILAGAPNTVYVFPNDPGQKIVKWSLPDDGFYLQNSDDLGSPWNSLVSYTSFPAGGFRNALVPSSALSPDYNFFQLIKRTFTKLQVLLPGETAAPGTLTGKTGTPTPQQPGAAFDIVVNAVSADWFPMTAVPDQQINLSSSDPAFGGPAFPGTMVAGQIIYDAATWDIKFGTAGTWTITATDATDPTKTAGISSPVVVAAP